MESVSSDESTAPKIPVLDFPDGGFTAWLMVFGAWWISFSTFGMNPPQERNEFNGSGFVNSFGVFETYYTTHQLASNTPSDIAWIGSFQVTLQVTRVDNRSSVCSVVGYSLVGYLTPMVLDGYYWGAHVFLFSVSSSFQNVKLIGKSSSLKESPSGSPSH